MGLTFLRLEIANPARPNRTRRLRFLIDSGAVYSVVPKRVLRELGIRSIGEETFTLADGSEIVREKGIAFFKYKDRAGGSDVIFGENGDSILLGPLTLEALGFSFDPLKRKLTPLPMILA